LIGVKTKKIDWIFMFTPGKEHEQQIYTHTINGIRTETSTNFALSRKYRFFSFFFVFLFCVCAVVVVVVDDVGVVVTASEVHQHRI